MRFAAELRISGRRRGISYAADGHAIRPLVIRGMPARKVGEPCQYRLRHHQGMRQMSLADRCRWFAAEEDVLIIEQAVPTHLALVEVTRMIQ